MADRVYWTGLEASGPDGRAATTKQAEHFETLFNSISLRPTVISNSGNDYTITIDPPLNAGDVLPPMSFFIKPNANNSGNVRIRLTSSNPYYELLKSNGEQFASGQFRSDTNYFIVYLDGKFYSLSDANTVDLSSEKFKYTLTTSGTLDITSIKAAKDPNTSVFVQVWAGGGGGSRNSGAGGGGGGGAYCEFWFILSDLPDVISYTIGAGGAGRSGSNGSGTNGGDSIFNATLRAYGGQGAPSGGGKGGGSFGNGDGWAAAGSNAPDIHGGGGGGGTSQGGGASAWGGAGGGGGNNVSGGFNGTGGVSKFGGNGGNSAGSTGGNGSIPGGGGGATSNDGTAGNGARGEIWVTIF